ncbi:drug/metabolite transporter (DMT)-like permease [Paenibacillus amylolyticus]|uniref:Drug/metabolite transporter (DMT)-like permease n=1 Tax=Paenibacillus amylolyticus TaxID=1451 RepID=A0AAP5LNB8_PAEAM|nr:DMT family transporter [Paenibacillus amylolyticus]MDR6723303.1 drug/metabolite transporter (DMT)-like permease [Paenibacillus amylolyticus]
MTSLKHTGRSIYLLFFVGIIAISFSSIFVRWSSADVAVIAMYRLFLTNLLMLPFIWKYRHEMLRLNFRQWALLVASGVMLALHFLLWMGSLRLTSVASSTVILALEPILILAGSIWLFKAKVNRMMIIGMGIALLGSIAIGAGDFQLAGTALQGDILSLLGTIAVAAHMLLGQFLRSGLSAFSYNFWVFFVAACTLAVYNLIQGHAFGGYAATEWGIFLLLAIVPTIFGHYLFNWLLQYMNATTVSMGVLGEPVFSSLLAWMLLGESLSTLQMSAGVFILFGVWVFIRYGKTKPQIAPAEDNIVGNTPAKPTVV